MQIDRQHYQVIFDPVSKGAVIIRKDKTAYLNGPFASHAEADAAAFAYLEANDGLPDQNITPKEKSGQRTGIKVCRRDAAKTDSTI